MKIKHLLPSIILCLFTFPALALTISFEAKDAACGNNNGSILTTVFGGTAPFNYLWSDGQTVADIQNLAPGIYTLTVTDALLDTDTQSVTIGNTTEITGGCLSYVVPGFGTGISHPCNALCNGIGYLSVYYMNGTPPYTISTSMTHPIGSYGPTAIPTVEAICSEDIYTVYITDALGCTGTACPTFSYPATSFDYTVQITPACNGVNNGNATLTFINMSGVPTSGIWTGPTPGVYSQANSFVVMSSLLPGNYVVTVTNDNAVTPCDTVILVTIPDMGTNCGTISGKVYIDSTPNCIADVSDPIVPNRLVRFLPGPYYGTSDNQGNYIATLPYGIYSAETITDYYFSAICTVTGINLNAVSNAITGIDLGDSTGTDLDLSVGLSSSAARPGFAYTLYATVINHSYALVSNPEVVLDYDPVLTLTASTIPYTITGPSQITLQFPAIGVFGSNYANLTFSIPPNPGLIGTILTNSATVNANQPEPNLTNNSDVLQQFITGSFDPNDKKVWPSFEPLHIYLVDVDSLFRYTIRFQNTGNDTAFNVVLVDTLNEFLDITSFQMLGSSHNCHWEITGTNVLKVYYDNILLPDSNVNEPASNGLFSFSLTHTPALGQQVLPYILENTAAIYFDFNPPVITNTEFNTIDISVGLNEPQTTDIIIQPNPAHETVSISSNARGDIKQITIFDIQGREIYKTTPLTDMSIIQLNEMVSGMYFVTIEGAMFHLTKKLIKY